MTPPPAAPVAPVPLGTGLRLRPGTRVGGAGRTLRGAGGDRVLRLHPRAVPFVASLPGHAHDPATRRLARTLIDAGVAEPWWPGPPPGAAEDVAVAAEVTVVVPVHDRPAGLARLLAALPSGLAVVVVDDASSDPAPLADLAAAHGARLLRHERNRGPAAARNTGLTAVRTPLVAFCDSDVVPEPGWLAGLHRHLVDPTVAVAAPRVLALPVGPGERVGALGAYEAARSSLDLGPRAAQVRPRGPVAYVPSACLLARVDALGDGFAEQLRSGEDVDLVWRLVGQGHRVRYDPAVRVSHDHRTRLGPWLRRKAFYGASAADLAARHGDAVAVVVLSPWAACSAVALLVQRRWSLPAVVGAWALATVAVARRLPSDGPADRPWRDAAGLAAGGVAASATQAAASLTRHHWPLALLAATRSRRARRALLVAALAEGLHDHRRVGSGQSRAAYLLLHRLDDLAYGAGVWGGALRARSPRALLPVLVRGGRTREPRHRGGASLVRRSGGPAGRSGRRRREG